MRILFITSIPPMPTWGSAMTFYRHFCERGDFTISVITDNTQVNEYKVPYSYLIIDEKKMWKRLTRSRFHLLPHTFNTTVGFLTIPRKVLEYANEFQPEAIFTMAGTFTKMAILAGQVSRKLNIPLIGSFNDWWYYNAIYHSRFHELIDKRFRNFYQRCDLALCTSEGMKNELGVHRNAIIIYPTGALLENVEEHISVPSAGKFTVAFGGNLGEWYGKMMESLITAAKESDIQFKIFGGNPSWSKEFDVYVKEKKIYAGQITFEQLKEEMVHVHGLLLFMGFDEKSRIIESTSFKTKFLDYLIFKRPIFLWGPSYCSAVVTAKEFDSAEYCASPSPTDFLELIERIKNEPARQTELVLNGQKMYQDRFHPDKVHEKLKDSVRRVIDAKLTTN